MNAGRDQIELLFRERNGEWVFRAPNPWIIGNAQHYMVNNAQKDQIIGILTPQHPVRMGIYFSISILAWICVVAGVMLGFGFFFDESGSPSVVVLSLMLVPVLLAVLAMPLQQKRRLHTILSGARPTNETISFKEIQQAANARTPFARLLGMGSLMSLLGFTQVLNLAARNSRHPLFSDALSWLLVLVATLSICAAAINFAQAAKRYLGK